MKSKTVKTIVALLFCVCILTILATVSAYAYTSLIAATDFDPVRTDVTTVAVGIISIALIVVGLGILVSVLRR